MLSSRGRETSQDCNFYLCLLDALVPRSATLPRPLSVAHLDALIAYLHPRGSVEGPLRQAVSRLKRDQVAHAARSKEGEEGEAGIGTRAGEGRGPSQTQSLTGTACEPPALGLVGSVAPASVGAGAGAPATGYQLAISSAPEILKPTRGLWEPSSEESTAADGSDGGGGDRGEAGATEETELEALRSELTGIYHSLPEAAFDPFWGSDSRQVHTCASPPLIPLRQSQHLSAALICARPIPRPPFRVNSDRCGPTAA